MAEYKDKPHAAVVDVDCTASGKSLCTKHGVRGYPTIKYGDPAALQDYRGGRSFADIKKFADDNLGPKCGPANIDLCDSKTATLIKSLQALSADDLQKKVGDLEARKAEAERNFKTETAALEKKKRDLEKEKKQALDEITAEGLPHMKALQTLKKAEL
jgi:hypothetical protein